MDDLEDVAEAVFDIEEFIEEVADPEDLIEDFEVDPTTVVVGLIAGLAGLFTLLMVLLSVLVFAFRFGLLPLVVGLAVFGFLVTLGAVVAFLYVRPDMPFEVQREVEKARERANDTPHKDGSMTEQEAIDALKDKYAAGEITDHELEEALDDALTSERPEEVVARYGGEDEHSHSYEREYE
jgi:uncharacterized membrane protein